MVEDGLDAVLLRFVGILLPVSVLTLLLVSLCTCSVSVALITCFFVLPFVLGLVLLFVLLLVLPVLLVVVTFLVFVEGVLVAVVVLPFSVVALLVAVGIIVSLERCDGAAQLWEATAVGGRLRCTDGEDFIP